MRKTRRGTLSLLGPLLCVASLQAQSITISPGAPTISPGASLQFTAQSSGLAPGVTITWYAGGNLGGDPADGTISTTGLYTAPAVAPYGGQVRINAIASDGSASAKTFAAIGTGSSSGGSGSSGSSASSNVPVIASVTPNPLGVGTDTVTISGSGFQAGVLVYDSYGAQSMIQYAPTSSNSGTITVGIYQGAAASSTFCVKNPGTSCSNSITVPVTASSGGNGTSAAPVLASVTPNPIPAGTVTVTILGSGFVTGALVYDSFGSQSMIQYAANSVSSGAVTATIYQGSAASSTFCVKNPGSACSNSITVPVNSGPPPPQAIAPVSVSVNLGATQQFTSMNATAFNATAGSITSAGLYTAPAAMPSSKSVTVTATGPGGAASATVTLINPNPQIIAPATATLTPGATQQFTSVGGSNWMATYGSITSAGLYTAPLVWPAGGADSVSVTGPNGNATAAVTLTPPTPTVTGVGANNQLPLGIFSATVAGSGFTPQSTVTLGGTAVTAVYSAGAININGFYGQSATVNLVVTNGTVSSQPFPVQVGVANAVVSPSAARRFLQQAAFGPTPADAAHVQTIGFQAWLNEQFAMAPVSSYSSLAGASQGGMPAVFLANAVTNADQLRQKVAFALSQIFVTSLTTEIWDTTMIPFQQMLLADAFTNYQQILTDVTLSPAMGYYLNMANNAQANAAAGTAANENYAREVMQLMSIGTKVLNADGTWPVDANNLPIPTYGQSDVTAMARIFTGWAYGPATPGGVVVWNAYINPNAPMAPYPPEHDISAKTVMGYSAPAGLSTANDLTGVLSYLANHPNTAPFISKQLIQHLVKSNPSPAYVLRISTAFTASKGDMPTVISAILLDPEARANDAGGNDQPTDGHLQEPALLIAAVVRAFGGQMTPANYYSSTMASMGQDVYSAPSVFNYYSPGYVVGGTGGLLGPEFQIDNPNAAVLRENFVATLFDQYSNPVQSYGPGTTIDLTPFLALAANPTTLVNALDLTLTEGVMPQGLKTIIVNALTGNQNGALYQVETAVYLILVSNYYNVWH